MTFWLRNLIVKDTKKECSSCVVGRLDLMCNFASIKTTITTMRRRILFTFLAFFLPLSLVFPQDAAMGGPLPKWQKGWLDIHFINTGRGNCTYIVCPDGTTMMIDIGALESKGFARKYAPMRVSPPFPDSSETAAKVVADYIEKMQAGQDKGIDYFLVTHFHGDHYGTVSDDCPLDSKGGYRLTGVTELQKYCPIGKLIDRGYPNYDFPFQMRDRKKDDGTIADPTFNNYLQFADYQQRQKNIKMEGFAVGSRSQFALVNAPKDFPSFYIQNIKAGNKIWTGEGNATKELFPLGVMTLKNYNENPLSCAIVLHYGNFSFFSGGDNTGLHDPDHEQWQDVETPMAPLVGNVSAMSLDHHGNRDATNLTFLSALDPQVVISQSWCSDHPGQEVGHRLISKNVGTHTREIYMTHLDPLTSVGIGCWFERKMAGKLGHYVIRVYPDSSFIVYTLDCTTHRPTITAISKLHHS